MNLTLIREVFTETSTSGKLFIDGVFECFTLEDTVREEKIYGETAIPTGTYLVIIDYSPGFKMELPHLLNVPNFEGIRIHIGNSSLNTKGCILVGTVRKKNWVSNSGMAFNKLFDKLEKAYLKDEVIKIEIR